jgi:hypothetical protein
MPLPLPSPGQPIPDLTGRQLYGRSMADFAFVTDTGDNRTVRLALAGSASATVWTAPTGGTQVTDLQSESGAAISAVPVGSSGSVPFYGPVGTFGTLWLDGGDGNRSAVQPADVGDIARNAYKGAREAQQASAGGQAELQRFDVTTEAEMLALTGVRRGAFARRADTGSTWQFLGQDPTQLDDWHDLSQVDLSQLDARYTAGREWVGGETGWSARVGGDQIDVSQPAPADASLTPPEHQAGDVILRQVSAFAYPVATGGPVTSQRPVGSAGPSQSVLLSSTVTLRGSDSDPDGVVVSRLWTQTAGPAVTLSSATVAQPTFAAPATETSLTFQYVVTDSQGLTSVPSATTVAVTAAPVTSMTTAWGASSDATGFASDEAKWAGLESDLRTLTGITSQMMTLRHTFENNGRNIPTALGGGMGNNKGLGVTVHLHNMKCEPWQTWATEFEAWRTAGFPDITSGATYGRGWALRQYLTNIINPFASAGHTVYLNANHEPENDPAFGRTDGAIDTNKPITGTGTGSGTDASQAAFRLMMAYFCKLVIRYGNDRVFPSPIFMGQTWTNTGTYPEGGGQKVRNPEHWNYWQHLTASEKLATIPGIDKYKWNTTGSGGPGNALRGFSAFHKQRGFAAYLIGEIAAAFDQSDDTMALLIARRIGDPAMGDSMRKAIADCASPSRSDLIPCVGVAYFHSGVNYTAGDTGAFLHNYTKRAYAQMIRSLPFSPTGA